MAQAKYMMNRFINAMGVVNNDVTDPLAWGSHIKEDGGHSTADKLVDKVLFHFRSHDGHALHLAFQHTADAECHSRWIIVCGADQNFIAVLDYGVFKSFN